MARAYSEDLRDRVIDAALTGTPARHAAARFGIGDAKAIVWVRRAREGQPRRSKIDPHRDYLLGLIAAAPRALAIRVIIKGAARPGDAFSG